MKNVNPKNTHYQISNEKNPVTDVDFQVINEELNKAGMWAEITHLNNFPDLGYVDVYYKYPHTFIDSEGIKFCVGFPEKPYPFKVDRRIGTFLISKDYRRYCNYENTNLPWESCYFVNLRLHGYLWVNGERIDIGKSKQEPAGMHMIYALSPDMESLRHEIRNQIMIIKGYIDNGTPVTYISQL